jgi:hypothetical protein
MVDVRQAGKLANWQTGKLAPGQGMLNMNSDVEAFGGEIFWLKTIDMQ